MSSLKNKIDWAVLVAVTNANPGGDPLNGNRPRADYDGYGEMSDVCIKRKLRNRMQDLELSVFVQSNDRNDDGCRSLRERADACVKDAKGDEIKFVKDACEKWIDVRAFGQVFAFKGDEEAKNDTEDNTGNEEADAAKSAKRKKKAKKSKGISIGIRGPVSIHQAFTVSPIDIEDMQISKSVNNETEDDGKKGSDTLGMKHFVRFGLYLLKGSINVQLAEKTGFSEKDADILKECLRTLFVNDSSSARPEGSMEVLKVYWWKHDCKDGKYSTAKVHRSLHVTPKENIDVPSSADDYVITLDDLPGLKPEIIDGI